MFVSGRVLGKLDRFLKLALLKHDAISVAAWERLGQFTATLLVTGLIVFIHRFHAFRAAH